MQSLLKDISAIKPLRDFHDHFYISLRNRYAFHTVGKAANSTVKLLMYKLDLQGTHYRLPSVHDRQMSPLPSPWQLHPDDLQRVLLGTEFFRFTFVRNPFSRLLSCYLDRIVPGSSRPYRELIRYMGRPEGTIPAFAEFIEAICAQTPHEQNNHWRVQYHDSLRAVIDYHFIGRQESFAEDFAKVYRKIAGRSPTAAELATNASPSRTAATQSLADYWTPSLQRLVADAYAQDFLFFGYSPDLAAR